jgi:hypothetical protein
MRAIDYLPYHFFLWAQHSLIGEWIASTTWVFAIMETIHIMSFSILLGTMIVTDLRLLGLGLRSSIIQQIARELAPWTLVSLAVTVISGACMFCSEALRLCVSGPFCYKMLFFGIAILIHFTIYWRAAFKGVGSHIWFGKIAATLSLCSWFLVALAGRGIAFLP